MSFADDIKAKIRRSAALDFLNNTTLDQLESDVTAILPDLADDHLVALRRLVDAELAKPGRQRLSV